MAGFANKVRVLKMALAVGAASCALHGGMATAQGTAARQTLGIDIPAGNLGDALIALGRQAKVQIAFLPDRVAGRKVARLQGNFTVDEALARLLRDTGLRVQRMQNGSYVVGGPTKATLDKAKRVIADFENDQGYVNGDPNIPEILVTGRRTLTLNTDIPRTENEAQPYTVFSREQIKRSGAMNLEDFLRDNLGAMTNVRTSAQGGGVTTRDSVINLRGLGADSTLILVDGRRYAEPNNGVTGAFVQSSISGIPLDQIERVEVLASSAAGQYGSNAVGGVINIVLRRDFRGIETSAYIGGTTKGDAIERRLSANATFPLLPKTTLTLSGSWKKSDPLLAGDTDFINDRLDFILKNNPRYLETAPLIYATTPNIRSANGGNLVLRPQYAVNGVTALGSSITYLPAGYRGIGQDGAAALLANAGRQNIQPGPADTGGPLLGDRFPLLYGSTVWSGTATIRSDVTSWLSLYGSASFSRVESEYRTTPVPTSINYAANNPLNPFTTEITVSFPSNEPMATERARSDTTQFIGGAIVKLPWHWQANFDVNTSIGNADSYDAKRQLSAAYYASMVPNGNGTVNVLLDTLAYPIAYQYDTEGNYTRRSPSKSSFTSYTLKLAGPIGFARLWGGKPVVTLVGEMQRQWFGDSVSYSDGPSLAGVSYSPERSLNTRSAYGELVLPVIGASNKVPLIHELELRLSGRYDAYNGRGTNTSFQCVNSHAGNLTAAEEQDPCPAPGVVIPYRRVKNDSFNPVVAAKWSVTPDIAFRGSYSTGYNPPQLSNVVEATGFNLFGFTNAIRLAARDPLRGNEPIGTNFGFFSLVEGLSGGNPNVDPQKSTSWSFGTILTPRFLSGLTLRADWTRIDIKNAYFDPSGLLNNTTNLAATAFADFLAAYPDRFRRAPVAPGDPYSVGKIIYVDATTANLSRRLSEAVDFSGSYVRKIGQGQLEIRGSATLLLKLTTQITASAPAQDITGVVSTGNFFGGGDSLKFRGVLSASYTAERWNLGARMRHFSGYYVNNTHTIIPEQGSNRVEASTYFDLYGGVRIFRKTELGLGLNNVLNTKPAIDVTRTMGYAPSGDPRLRTFYANLTQRF
ncbi:TonB-dependent receptor domain-containing protein [Sphingomonas sp. Sphisp140]|uniref:TonB-dependent receptor domain-containing protein n=1 Tax=unclassified Sphingomonas TaxID=196159 RepID=UPI0039AEB598